MYCGFLAAQASNLEVAIIICIVLIVVALGVMTFALLVFSGKINMGNKSAAQKHVVIIHEYVPAEKPEPVTDKAPAPAEPAKEGETAADTAEETVENSVEETAAEETVEEFSGGSYGDMAEVTPTEEQEVKIFHVAGDK